MCIELDRQRVAGKVVIHEGESSSLPHVYRCQSSILIVQYEEAVIEWCSFKASRFGGVFDKEFTSFQRLVSHKVFSNHILPSGPLTRLMPTLPASKDQNRSPFINDDISCIPPSLSLRYRSLFNSSPLLSPWLSSHQRLS